MSYYKHLKKEEQEFVDACVDLHELPVAPREQIVYINDITSPYRLDEEGEKTFLSYRETFGHEGEDESEPEYTTDDKLIYLSVDDVTINLSIKEAIAIQMMLQNEIEEVLAYTK